MEKNALTRKVLLAPLADDRLTAAREEAWIEKSPKEPADRRREEEGSGKEGTEGSLRIFSDLLSSLREAVVITDGQGRLRHMNRKAQKLTGWSLPEATNRPLPEVFRIKEDLVAAWEEVPAGRTSCGVLCHRDGSEFAIEYSAARIPNGEGQTRGAVIVFHDVTEKGNLLRDMTHRAHFDDLTIGAAISPVDGNSLTRLLRNADLAMYQAKKSGRNRIKFCSESLVSQGERKVWNFDPSPRVAQP